MGVVLFLIGLAVVLGTMVDALATTISASGAGPLTRWVSRGIWRLGLAVHRRTDSHALLATLGPVVVMTVLLMWVALLWTGYTFIFSANPEQIVSSRTQQPADLGERVYYTGFTIFTLGVGDFVPDSDFYRHITAVASVNGLFLVTLAITYIVPVLSAVVDKRQIACMIHGLGQTPQDVVLSAWDGTSCSSLTSVLNQLTPTVVKHAQRHLAYPVVHYFHSLHRRDSFPVQIAVLSEVVAVLERDVAPEARPDQLALQSIRSAIESYLEVLGLDAAMDKNAPGPQPNLDGLRGAGVPVSDAVGPATQRRGAIAQLLESQGWTWSDVYQNEAPGEG